MGHQSYVLLCTETTLSKHPAILPKSSCNVHLLRNLWLSWPILICGLRNQVYNTPLIKLFFQQTLDAPSDQSNNSSLTRYDQDHHRIRKRREKSTIILVSIVLIFLLCHMFRFSLKVCIFLPVILVCYQIKSCYIIV